MWESNAYGTSGPRLLSKYGVVIFQSRSLIICIVPYSNTLYPFLCSRFFGLFDRTLLSPWRHWDSFNSWRPFVFFFGVFQSKHEEDYLQKLVLKHQNDTPYIVWEFEIKISPAQSKVSFHFQNHTRCSSCDFAGGSLEDWKYKVWMIVRATERSPHAPHETAIVPSFWSHLSNSWVASSYKFKWDLFGREVVMTKWKH